MHYLIDGYNLLHHVGRLQTGRSANLEMARLELLRQLQGRFKEEKGTRVTVVFDARRAPPRVPEQEEYHGIEVRFTRHEEADDLIEDMIRGVANPQQLTIVSNDHRLKEAARRKGSPVMECVTFWESLSRRPKLQTEVSPEEERPPMSREEVDRWVREFGDIPDDGFENPGV